MARPTDIKPPFGEETAKSKVKAAQNACNTSNPEIVAQAYAIDSQWRNRVNILHLHTQEPTGTFGEKMYKI